MNTLMQLVSKFFRSSEKKSPEEISSEIEEVQTGIEDAAVQTERDESDFSEQAAGEDYENFGNLTDRRKELADPAKYFGLFDKYIPRYENGGSGKNIAIIDISSIEVEMMVVETNPKATFWLFDNGLDYEQLRVLCPAVDIRSCRNEKTDENLYNILGNANMKFDCVVGNPPYDGSLHLKILEKTMEHINEDGEIVWLAPVRWLQDPLAPYKKKSAYNKYKETISKHIESIDEYAGDVISMIFNAGLPACAIYHLNKNEYEIYNTQFKNSFFEKIYFKINNFLKPEFEQNKKDGYRVKISPIYGGGTAGNHSSGKETLRNIGKLICFNNGLKDNKPWYDFYAHNGATKIQAEIPYSIKFNSGKEAENFIASYQTKCVMVYTHLVKRDVNVSPEILVWMGDAVNPRTGLKGYLSEWTDDDFYEYFGITDDEKKIVEETMAKYKRHDP